jgi:isopenicillin-N epimerase
LARNIALAAEATSLLARRLNTEAGATGELAGAMGLVRLPLTGPASAERSIEVRAQLLAAGTDAPTHVLAGAIWLRLSAAAYNDIEHYERLGEIVAGVIRAN